MPKPTDLHPYLVEYLPRGETDWIQLNAFDDPDIAADVRRNCQRCIGKRGTVRVRDVRSQS